MNIQEEIQEPMQQEIIEPLQQEEQKEEIMDTELIKKKQLVQRAKSVCLDRLGKHPLTDISTFRPLAKKQFIADVQKLIDTVPEDEITILFNEIIVDKLFQPNDDYTCYNVQFMGIPSIPENEKSKIE